LRAESGDADPRHPELSTDAGLIRELEQKAQPWQLPPQVMEVVPAPLRMLEPECIVPILDRSRLRGLIALGTRLSEEPYSREDLRLLAAVATQAGLAFENIRFAEEIAERLERERRMEHEMEIARRVQINLLPRKHPSLGTLDYAATCIQAETVGGDYFDFLDLGRGRVAFVLADIAGKGLSAALLMANLQATLRSQYPRVLEDFSGLLRTVNGLFYENTEPNHYATFFMGLYVDATRSFEYANCGHNPPLVLRAGGRLERLEATATVLGLFENWSCATGKIELAAGDTFVLYTDGAVEAESPQGEEFGEARLGNLILELRQLSPQQLLQNIVEVVTRHTGGNRGDDLTLVVGRAIAGSAAPDP
jgi:serine phosphatase RsbU (regulator of sigma subunit)